MKLSMKDQFLSAIWNGKKFAIAWSLSHIVEKGIMASLMPISKFLTTWWWFTMLKVLCVRFVWNMHVKQVKCDKNVISSLVNVVSIFSDYLKWTCYNIRINEDDLYSGSGE